MAAGGGDGRRGVPAGGRRDAAGRGVSPLLVDIYLHRAGPPQGGLELHPDKAKVVDLGQGREGLDFPGCHFHARMPGRLRERKRIIRYYPHRWPSRRTMKRLREKARARTGRNRAGRDIRDVIADLNPLLRGWGSYFRTGNAAARFGQAGDYVVQRLRGTIRYPKAA